MMDNLKYHCIKILILLMFTSFTVVSQNKPISNSNLTSDEAQVIKDAILALPTAFRENKGQWDKNVLYRGLSFDHQISFLKNGVSFGFTRENEEELEEEQEEETEYLVWNTYFLDMNP